MEQSAFIPRRNNIDGNAILAMMQAQRERLPGHYGRITNRSTGQVVEKLGNAPIVENQTMVVKAPGTAKTGSSPRDELYRQVKRYNDFIASNDLNDSRINLEDYFNTDSPNYLDPTDPQGIDAEGQYLQNQLYRLQKDDRYVPDYEDAMEMSDEEFIKFEEKYLH